jgi:hypothetical protein
MRDYLAILTLLLSLLYSCAEVPDSEEQYEKHLLIEAVLVAENEVDKISVKRLNPSGLPTPVADADVELISPLGSIALSHNDNGVYTSDDLVLPSADYDLVVRIDDHSLTGNAEVPPLFKWINSIPGTITIDPADPFEQVLNLNWTENGEVEYVLKLTPLDEDAEEIDFVGAEGGQFAEVFALPQPESGTVLLASDFKVLGNHQLEVFAIYPDYAELFNPLVSSNRENVPFIEGQIEGGFGYFTGVSQIAVEFIVE